MSSSHRHRSATTTEPTSAASDLLPATASTSRREHSTHRDPQYHYNAAYYAHQSHDGGDGDGASDEYESQPHGTGTGTGSGRHKHKHTHSQSRGAAAATGGTRRGGKKASSRSPTPPPAPSRASLQPPKYSTVKAPRSGHHSTFSAAFAAASSAPSTPKASSFVRQPQVPPQRDSPRKHKSGERSGDGGGGGGRDRERDRDRDRDRERDRDRGREGDQERERGGSGGREIDPGRDHNVARVGSPEVVTPIPKPSSRARAGTVAITQTRDRPLIPYVSTQQPTAQHYPTGTPNNNSLVVSGSLSNNRANSKGSIQPTSAASPQKSHRSTSPPLGVSSSTSGWWEGTDMRYTNESTTDTESGSSQGSADDASGNVSGGIRKISHEKLSEPKHKHSKHPKNDREDPVSLLPKSRHTDQMSQTAQLAVEAGVLVAVLMTGVTNTVMQNNLCKRKQEVGMGAEAEAGAEVLLGVPVTAKVGATVPVLKIEEKIEPGTLWCKAQAEVEVLQGTKGNTEAKARKHTSLPSIN
ncbi:hypothetical protein Pelo_15495 [Pelomyxa schiedti]|nr:hypothetical protein Pelo_15495 [Pelomyxa schiedti]